MYYFIVNPKSSSGKGLELWKAAEKWLKSHNVDYEAYFTEKAGHGTILAREISTNKAPCTIIAVGGDGTVDEVINGLENYDNIRFTCIPTGSGNDLARGLSLSKEPEKILEAVLHPKKICHLSIGETITPKYSRRFIVSSGIGFDAAVCHEVATTGLKSFLNKLHLGKLTYLIIALKQLLVLPLMTVELTVDDQEPRLYHRTFFAAAMNLPYEGGGFRFCPNADAQDDYLDLCIVSGISKLKALCILPTAFPGLHGRFHGVEITRFQKAKIRALRPLAVHADGEPLEYQSELTISLRENKLPFILG